MNTEKTKGFTLIEVLIALVIFAIVGVITAVALRNVINTHQRLAQYDDQLQQIEVAVTLIRRDFSQALDRPIEDQDGQPIPAFIDNGQNVLSFTRGGLLNPFDIGHRSNLQRITYDFSDGKIVRQLWPVLDRLSSTKPTSQVLLNQVSNVSITLYDVKGLEQRFWPPSKGSNLDEQNQSALPRGIRIQFIIAKRGPIEIDIPIVGQGVLSAENASSNS